MKTLFVLRHAKSDQTDPELRDFDRPLNKRGERDAPRMGEYIRKTENVPGIVYASPALRAITTARKVSETSGFTGEIVEVPGFYNFDNIAVYIDTIRKIPDQFVSAMVVGHNPTLEILVSELTSKGEINIKLPTAGLVNLSFAVENWRDIEPGTAILNWMVVPKALPYR
jgi:phosphohistidine phosphatase